MVSVPQTQPQPWKDQNHALETSVALPWNLGDWWTIWKPWVFAGKQNLVIILIARCISYLRWVFGQIALNLENNCRDLLADDFKKSGVSPFGREQDVRTMLLKKGWNLLLASFRKGFSQSVYLQIKRDWDSNCSSYKTANKKTEKFSMSPSKQLIKY